MNVHNKWLIIIASLVLPALTACQRVIDIQPRTAGSLLVIEGNLTNVSGPQTVSISKTVPYADANVYPPVSGAVVTIGSISGVSTLKESTTQPGQYTISSFRTKTGQAYTLTVKLSDQTYTATSAMPTQVLMDSIGVNDLSVGKKAVKTVSVYYQDPVEQVNQYRFVLYVNSVQVKQIFTINDALTNGRIVNTTLYQDDITIKRGDKVEVEMQCIDQNIYNYWYNLSQQGGNGPGNSATPSNPTSNISNGALGYFSTHTAQRKSITVL